MSVPPHRREFLYGLGATLGTAALNAMLAEEGQRSESKASAQAGPLAPKKGTLPVRAKACIFLTMEGGPSHIDTFDPKPELHNVHMKKFVRNDEQASAMASGSRYFVESPFSFRKCGQSGADMATEWQRLADVADEICFYRGLQAESVDHPTALYQINTGNRLAGDPALGAWTTYGLGSENQNLPGFIVLPELAYPQGGAANWSNGFLPADFQGTPLRPVGTPMLNLQPPPGIDREHQRANLDLLTKLNRRHATDHPAADALKARLNSYELAFRMQAEVPELIDLSQESQATLDLYGIGNPTCDSFARKCLLARRMVEQGVRFVQLYNGTWDSHDDIAGAHRKLIAGVDQPIAALIADLRQRGLLDETLVLWGGEFGRSPDNGIRGGIAYGRDHNAKAMTVWMAGGGTKAGETVGATDEVGAEAVECVHPIRDLHVTLLHLMGLDDNKLTYYHAGRFKQLSQFGGKLIRELVA